MFRIVCLTHLFQSAYDYGTGWAGYDSQVQPIVRRYFSQGLCLEISFELRKSKKCPWKPTSRSLKVSKYLQKSICLEEVHLG